MTQPKDKGVVPSLVTLHIQENPPPVSISSQQPSIVKKSVSSISTRRKSKDNLKSEKSVMFLEGTNGVGARWSYSTGLSRPLGAGPLLQPSSATSSPDSGIVTVPVRRGGGGAPEVQIESNADILVEPSVEPLMVVAIGTAALPPPRPPLSNAGRLTVFTLQAPGEVAVGGGNATGGRPLDQPYMRDKYRTPSNISVGAPLNTTRVPSLPAVGQQGPGITTLPYTATTGAASRINKKSSRQPLAMNNPKICVERPQDPPEEGHFPRHSDIFLEEQCQQEQEIMFQHSQSLEYPSSSSTTFLDGTTMLEQPGSADERCFFNEDVCWDTSTRIRPGFGSEANPMGSDPTDATGNDRRGGVTKKVSYPEVGRPAFPYTEPISDGSATFLQRLSELSGLEAETVRWERARASKRVSKTR